MEYASFLERKARHVENVGIDPARLHARLFPFQRKIVRWAVRRGRACIFADCGLGKTLMQLEWARHVPGDVLILAPLAVSEQTVEEGARFGFDVNIATGDDDVTPGINITNYEKLHRFDLGRFTGVVLDESSILKSYTGKIRNQIIDESQAIAWRLACTATPAPNDFMELGNHAEFVGAMTRTEMLAMFFVHDGGSTQNWRIKGHAQDEFWKWVGSWGAFVRKPSDLGDEDHGFTLPPIAYHPHVVDSDHIPGYLFAPDSLDLSARRAIRRESVDDRAMIARDLVASNDEPWILWCNLNAEADKLAELIPEAVEIRGADPPEKKRTALLGFAHGAFRVLITKPKIAGFGMNWQHCSNVAFVGLSDSYEAFYQATRRCWRFGQKDKVDVHIITSANEDAVVHNVMRKERDAQIMGDELTKQALKGFEQTVHIKTPDDLEEMHGEKWRMVRGDVVQRISGIETGTIDYTVFSPPFASLYTYTNSERDMGNCKDGAEFAQHFAYLVPELLRVTKPGRLLSFHCMNLPTSKTRDGFIGISDFRGGLIRAFVGAGWIFHSEVVIWKDPVTAMQRTKALGLLHKQLKKDSCMSRQGIPDYLVTMRKPGENPDPVTHTNETFPVKEWQHYASPVWDDINPSDTLSFREAREDKDERHICPLQLEVIRRALRMWSRPDDLVLSPFAGIGSEGYVAIEQGRRFVGVELKDSYFRSACRNLATAEEKAEQEVLF